MGLNNALHNAYTGLTAATRRADVTAGNIANATTEGYARREVMVSDQVLGAQGAGVRVDGVRMVEEPVLTADRRRAEAELGEQTARSEAMTKIAGLIGDSDDPGALFARYEALEGGLRDLADAPESNAARTQVVTKANDLASGFNKIADEISTLREDADREIGRQIDNVNQALKEIEHLNGLIVAETARGRDYSELQSQRAAYIDSIAETIPVVTIAREGGRLAVFTRNGQSLVDGPASQLEFTQSPIITPDMDYQSAVGPLSGVTLNGKDVTPGVSAADPLGGGALSGLFEVRDEISLEFQTQVDALASDLIDRFTAAEPLVPAGDPGIFVSLGAPQTDPGLAGRLAVNAKVDPDQGGDLWMLTAGIDAAAEAELGDAAHAERLLDAMTQARTAPTGSGLSGDKSAADLAADFSSLIATQSYNADTTLSMRSARYETLRKSETATIGVDIDHELQNLTLIETAYAANARVMQTIDQLFRRILEI